MLTTTENSNITEMISTPSQAENVYETVRSVRNKERHDTLRRGFEANYKVYESIETERTELTTVRKKPNEEELSLINLIAKEYLDKETSSKQLSFELINSLIYSSAVTLKQYLNDTTLKSRNDRISTEPKWVVQFTTKINRIRRDIAHIELIQKCKQTNSYTANQKRIRNRLIRKYRNIKQHTLTYHIKCLKQELKATSSRLNYQKKVSERKRINKLFSTNPRSVYRSFKAGNTEIKVTPTLKEIEDYWNDIWGTTGHFNNSPEWLNVLEKEYCDKIQPEDYNINTDTLQTAIKKSTNLQAKI